MTDALTAEPPVRGEREFLRAGDVVRTWTYLHHLRRDQRLSDEQRASVTTEYDKVTSLLSTATVSPSRAVRDSVASVLAAGAADDRIYELQPSILGYPDYMDETPERQKAFASAAAREFPKRTIRGLTQDRPQTQREARMRARLEDLYNQEQRLTQRKETSLFGLIGERRAEPVLSASTERHKLHGLPFVGEQPDGSLVISDALDQYPIFDNLERGYEALQVLDQDNPILEDERGKFLNVRTVDGELEKRYFPADLTGWGSDVNESITDAQMGIDPRGVPFARHLIGRNTFIGSVWHWVGAGGEKGLDYDVDSLLGTMAFVPNITGNKARDRQMLLDPMAVRMMHEADSEGAFGNIAGQTIVGMLEFVAVQRLTGGLVSAGGKAMRALPVVGAPLRSAPMQFFGRAAEKARAAFEGAAKSKRLGALVRGGQASGLNFGTLAQARQEVWYGLVQSMWQPGMTAGEGIANGFDEASVEFAFGMIGSPFGGNLGRLVSRVKNIELPRLRAQLAGADVPSRQELRYRAGRRGRNMLLDPADTGRSADLFETRLRERLGYLPSSDPAIRDEVLRLFKGSVNATNLLEMADMAYVGLFVGGYFAAREEAVASGEDWDPFSLDAATATMGKIRDLDPQAMGTAAGFVGAGGLYWGAQRVRGGVLSTQLGEGGPTVEEALSEVSEVIANNQRRMTAADVRWLIDTIGPESLLEASSTGEGGEISSGELSAYVGVELGGRPVDMAVVDRFRKETGKQSFTGAEFRAWLAEQAPIVSLEQSPNEAPRLVFAGLGAAAERNANAGLTRSDPDYRLSAGEQLTILWGEADDGPEAITRALAAADTRELVQLWRQTGQLPETLQPGEVGATRAEGRAVRDVIRGLIEGRRGKEGPLTSKQPFLLVDTPSRGDDPAAREGGPNPVLERQDAPERPGLVEGAARAFGGGETRWNPSKRGAWELRRRPDGNLEAHNTRTGRTSGSFEDTPEGLRRAVRHYQHVTKGRVGNPERGTRRGTRMKAQTEPDPDRKGQSGVPAEVARGLATEFSTPAVEDAIQAQNEDPDAEGGVLEVEAVPDEGPMTEGQRRLLDLRAQQVLRDTRSALESQGRDAYAFHVEQMLTPDVVGAGFPSVAAAFDAARRGELPEGLEPAIAEVLRGEARVPFPAEVVRAIDRIAELHAGRPGNVRDFDGGAHRAARRYIGPLEARNSRLLDEALARAEQDARRRPRRGPRLLPPPRPVDVERALSEASEEAVIEGDLDSARAAQELAAGVAQDDDAELAARVQLATEEIERQAARQASDSPSFDIDRVDRALGDREDVGVGPHYDGFLFDPGTGDDVAFYEGVRTWSRGELTGRGSGLPQFLASLMAFSGSDDVAKARTYRALTNGAVLGTYGNSHLLGLIDAVAGWESGTARDSYEAMIDHALARHGERIQRTLGAVQKTTGKGPVPLFTSGSMQRRSLAPYAIASLGVAPHLAPGSSSTIRVDAIRRLVEDIIGPRGASAGERLSNARRYLLGVDAEGASTGDPLGSFSQDGVDQAAGFLKIAAERARRFLDNSKFTQKAVPGGGRAASIPTTNLRGQIASQLVRRATGKNGSIDRALEAIEGHPTAERLASELIEELAGHEIVLPARSVSGKSASVERVGRGGETSVADAFDSMAEDLLSQRGIDRHERTRMALEAVLASSSFARKAVDRMKSLTLPSGSPLLGDSAEPDQETASIFLHALVDEASPLHSKLRSVVEANFPDDADAVFDQLVADAEQGVLHARMVAYSMDLDDDGNKRQVNSLGQTRFEALELAMARRASDPKGYTFTADEVEALQEFLLLEEITLPDGTMMHRLSQGTINRMAEEIASEVQGMLTEDGALADLEDSGDIVYLYSFDPISILFGGLRPPRPNPDRVGKVRRHGAQRVVSKYGPKIVNPLVNDVVRVVATRAGRTSKSFLKGDEEAGQDLASKRSIAQARAHQTRLMQDAEVLITDTLLGLTVREGELFAGLIHDGSFQDIEGPAELARALGVDGADKIWNALVEYNTRILELGRQMVLSGALTPEQYDSFVKDGRTSYLMRSFWPLPDGTPRRAETLNPQGSSIFAPSAREMNREEHTSADKANLISDPTLLVAKTYAEESARVALYSVLRDAADDFGIPTEHGRTVIGPHLRRHFRLAALPPSAKRDPHSGRAADPQQHAMWEFLTGLRDQMDKGVVVETPVKRRIVERLLTNVDLDVAGEVSDYTGGVLFSDTTMKQLELVLSDFVSMRGGGNLLDSSLETLDAVAAWWRRGRTVLRFKHILLSLKSSLLTNHFAGSADLGDAIDGFLRNRGPYADSGRALMLLQDYVRSGRQWDLTSLGDDGALVLELERFVDHMGGATLIGQLVERTEMRETFQHLLEVDPDFQFRMKQGGIAGEVLESVLRDMGGRRTSVRSIDRKVAALTGNVGSGADAKVQQAADLAAQYQQNETFYKFAAYLALKRQYPERAATDAGRLALMDDAVAATADYSEMNPWLYEMTARFRRSEVRKAFSPGIPGQEARDAAWYGTRLLVGVPFLSYNFVIIPTLARALVSGRGRGALRALTGVIAYSAILNLVLRQVFGDDDEKLEALSRTDAYPTFSWESQDQESWEKQFGDMHPGVIGPVDGTGLGWKNRQQWGANFFTKLGKGVGFINAGPDGTGRSTIIDQTSDLGSSPIEFAMRMQTSNPFDSDPGNVRQEGMMGFLWQQGMAIAMNVGAFINPRNRERSEQAITSTLEWLQHNFASDMNPATAFLSDTTGRFVTAANGGTPLRERIAGIRRPAAESKGIMERLGGALTQTLFTTHEIPARTVYDERHFDSLEAATRKLLGDRGVDLSSSGASEEERNADLARSRVERQMQSIFGGAFATAQREGYNHGGFEGVLMSFLDIAGDVEQHTDPRSGITTMRLVPGRKPEDLTALGRFLHEQPEELRGYAIDWAVGYMERAFDSEAGTRLGFMVDRREVDPALAERVFTAIMHPKRSELLKLIDRELDSDPARPTYVNVWRGLQQELDPDTLNPGLRRIYDRVQARMTQVSHRHPDDIPSPREILRERHPDLLPHDFVLGLSPRDDR